MSRFSTARPDNAGLSELGEAAGENSHALILRKFVSAIYGAMERKGLTLNVRTDFAELWALNREEALRGAWYPLPPAVNPNESDLTATNSYWIAAETRSGEIVATHACRVFNWPDTNLYEQARAVWYGRDAGQPCTITSEAARLITGVVTWGVAAWVRPDFRGQQLSYIVPRFSKAYSFAHWPINYSTCF